MSREMSRETSEWLNSMTLIGFTEKRGTAWHYREGSDNHYPGAVPVEDVRRRLFNWEALEADVLFEDHKGQMRGFPDKKIYYRSDNFTPLGIHGSGHAGHGYDQWLVGNVSTLLDDSLAIGSAGLLRNGAQAWVSVEVPENITTPEGVVFRPNLLAVTSFDGSLATTYKRVVTNVVCDNTMSMALGEAGQQWKSKHTRKSSLRVAEARSALDIMFEMSNDFSAEVARLTSLTVTPKQWGQFLDLYIPVPEAKDGPRGTAGVTRAQNKRDSLETLWTSDKRVVQWNGTAWGVLQAVNTYVHHEATVKSVSRVERNFERAMRSGTQSIEELDKSVMAALDKVLVS